MQRLNDRTTVPPDGFRYFQPETRMWIRASDYVNLFELIKAHRQVNKIPLGALWKAEVEDQLCKSIPTGWCRETEPGKAAIGESTRVMWEHFVRGTTTLIEWAKAGVPVVEQARAEARAQICTNCYKNVAVQSGCSACGQAVNMTLQAARGRTTSLDVYLKTCAVCKCSNRAQVHFPIHILAQKTPESMLPLFPDFCWKKQEIMALKQEPLRQEEVTTTNG
jgi:hypothetical protein